MDKVEALKKIIASYWQIDPDAIDWDMELGGRSLKNFSSLRMLRFIASVEEQLEVNIQDPSDLKRLRDLLRLATG